MAATLERRFATELAQSGRRLEGYAATFASTADLGAFRERIAPGAFRDALAGDILALLDHDPGKVLGRTRTGTLELREDDKGLAFALDVPDTAAGRDVLALAARGDLGGMSFGFLCRMAARHGTATRAPFARSTFAKSSVVSAWPAYEGTEIALRSMSRQNGTPEAR